MSTLSLVLTIAIIDFLSIITPGQDFAIVTRNTLKYSIHIGYFTVLGIGFITFLHCLLAMTGLSIIISQNPNLLAGIKTIGALYLIYLGGSFFRNAKNLKSQKSKKTKKMIHPKKAFQMGAIANLFNIEPIMAFVSIFAIVLPPTTPLNIKIIICILLPLNTMIYLAFITKIFSVQQVQIFLQNRMKCLEQVIGIMLIFFGSKTLVETKK